jgi:hypothetical protein
VTGYTVYTYLRDLYPVPPAAPASCLQERLALAEAEYVRGLAKLKSTAGELESLGSRVQSSGKAARGE